ncbi:MAG: efflux RND transporter periplasmic adaptor subunit [Polyangiaceae bacterium]|jgi:HlyD family secretion protein|nr:efflux RND transporter periplasmic adaptor subunit [Polyangiaceae bacterium]
MSDPLSSDLAALRIRRDETPPRGSPLRAIAIVGVVVGLGAAAYVYAAPMVEARLFKTEVAVTEVARVSPAQASIDLTATGYVVPERTAKVGSDVPGRITKVAVREGQSVKAGDPIFELDAGDQQTGIATAQAKAKAAGARALAAKANADEVRVQLERAKRLADSGAATVATADDLAARLRALEEATKAAEAEAGAAAVDARGLASNLRHYVIRAPSAGRIVGKPAELGEVVTPEMSLAQLVDFGSLMVETDVPEARLGLVKPGGPAEVTLDAYPDRRLRASVHEITPRVNRSKATVIVKVAFRDPVEGVLPEMAARVGFLAKALDEAAIKEPPKIVLPAAALAERGGAKVVFVVDNGRVRMVPVTLGAPFGGGFELKDGPAPGTRVIKAPPSTLADGQSIKERTDG